MGDSKMSHPTYQKMVLTAIAALKERNGSSLQAIKKAISAAYPTLSPGDVNRSTTAALKKMVVAGSVVKTKSSYKLSQAAKKPVAKKKPAAKKTAAKKTTAKKSAAKKAPAKKSAAKKAPAKKSAAKKEPAKKSAA